MQFKSAVAAAIALLMLTAGGVSQAAKKKKAKDSSSEVSTGIDKQLEWENKVVGPKAGLDKSHLAAIQEQGRREDAERKKEPPKKVGRAAGIDAPASSELPTMDIEKPAEQHKHGAKKVAAAEPRKKDSLDNLLDSEGIKPDNPNGGRTGDDGLGSILASDSSGSHKHAGKRHRR
jgi:hypothetical protein